MSDYLIHQSYLLKKFPGKGGWTYCDIPEIKPNKENPFGWVEVEGFVDDYPIEFYKLMPKGNGQLFMPVKAAIRKKIKKEAGDEVMIRLRLCQQIFTFPQLIEDAFEYEDDNVIEKMNLMSENEKKLFSKWIMETTNPDTQAQRINVMIDKIKLGLQFKDTIE